MRLSTSINVLFDHQNPSVENAIERLAAAGFRVLDFNFTDSIFENSPFMGEQWKEWVENIAKLAAKLGISFSQAHGPIYNIFEEETEKYKLFTELSRRAIVGSGILGVKWIVFHTGSLPGALDKEHLDFMKQRNIAWVSSLLEIAEKHNVGIALENLRDGYRTADMFRIYGATPSELIEVVDEINHPLVGLCLDTGHAAIQRLDLEKTIIAMGKRLKALHVQDNNGLEDQHLAPFYGIISWETILRSLKTIGYEGDFTYEVQNFTRVLPDHLRDSALKFLIQIGNDLLGRF